MDINKIRALAGMPSVRSVATPKSAHDPVLEANDAAFIVSSLRTKFAEYSNVNVKIRESIKDYLQSNSEAPNAEALKEALGLVSTKAAFEERNSIRKMAGLPPLVEKEEDEEETEESEESDEDAGEEEESEESEESTNDESEESEESEEGEADTNDIGALVQQIAAKLLKDGAPEESELAEFLQKVYDAGRADAAKQAS